MPIYEYRCASCGHQQEFLQKVSDAPLAICTKCGKPSFTKMVTAAGFQLKGSGWYATDFKNGGAKPAAKAVEASKGEASKGEAKPASESAGGESKTEGDQKPAKPATPPASPSVE